MAYVWIVLFATNLVSAELDENYQNLPVASYNSDVEHNELHHREKRYISAWCNYTDNWHIYSGCHCGDHCWVDSYKYTIYDICKPYYEYTNAHGDIYYYIDCYVTYKQCKFQLTPTITFGNYYTYIYCHNWFTSCPDGVHEWHDCYCYGGNRKPGFYTDTCLDTGAFVAILMVVVFGIASVTTFIVVRKYIFPRMEKAKRAKKIAEGIIPLQFNVLAVVDDVDEFKLYLTYIRDALHDQNPKLVFQRLSIFDLLHYNYEIKCDQLLVFLETTSATVKKKKVTSISKKVKYQSIAVVCMEDDATTQPVESDKDKLCLVPSLKHIWVWLPVVLEALFQNKGRSTWTNLRPMTYFIHEDEQTPKNVQHCKELRYTLDNILTLFGAKVANSEKAAMHKIALLDSINETNKRWKSKYFIFVSWGIGANKYRQNNSMNVFGRKEMILGITRLLFEMNLIAYKGKENLEAIRYNPLSKEFIKDNENIDV